MKTFALVLTATLLIVAGTPRLKRAVSPQCENPKAWYLSDNEVYFDNRLPLDTVVDYSNHEAGTLAATTFENGRFHIAFNKDYASSALVVHTFLIHECSHVLSWDEEQEHGPRWKAEMHKAISHGAIINELVDSY